jgi:hypothetical protein
MTSSLRYYATEKLYHASAEYDHGLAIDSRFSTLEKTAEELLKAIKKENEELPWSTRNGANRDDHYQHGLRKENPRPLSQEEEEKFLDLLGL